MMGAISMVFYGCWLVAKPVNSDIDAAIQAGRDFYTQSVSVEAKLNVTTKGMKGKEETGPERSGDCYQFRRNYTVRVMVPCYKESLEIVQRTIIAALRAERPVGTRVVIYLCDDGGDVKKKAWIDGMEDPNVIYVTGVRPRWHRPACAGEVGARHTKCAGRDKTKKSMNGKSDNLNNCLRLIYPDTRDPDDPTKRMVIPLEEVMLLFDADQTCSTSAITTLLRYIDSGDDVGVALSPQLMYNVRGLGGGRVGGERVAWQARPGLTGAAARLALPLTPLSPPQVLPDCDIFNHQNVRCHLSRAPLQRCTPDLADPHTPSQPLPGALLGDDAAGHGAGLHLAHRHQHAAACPRAERVRLVPHK